MRKEIVAIWTNTASVTATAGRVRREEPSERGRAGGGTPGSFSRQRQTRVNNARRWVNKINRPL